MLSVGLAENFVLAGGVEMQHFKDGHASKLARSATARSTCNRSILGQACPKPSLGIKCDFR
ncbi:MAG: hypothetical protein RR499_06930, partial [Mucinivorans sp.]